MQRNTIQRKAIRDVITEADRPLSPQEVLDEARQTVPGIGIATVYRTVRTLMNEGWLSPVDLPGEPTRYECAGKEHHHHFHCKGCDKVFEVEGCFGDMQPLLNNGFIEHYHEVFIYGLCSDCQTTGIRIGR